MKVTQKIAITYTRLKFRVLATFSSVKAAERAFTLFCTPYLKSRKKPGPIFSQAQSLTFTLPGYIIRGYSWNATGTKTALLLHGFSSSVYNFGHYVTLFTEKGYRVLAFDAPAHGQSTGKTVNAVQYKEMIMQVQALYGPVDCFLAHSFGGLAVCLALEEIPHTPQHKIILIAPATETSTAVNHAFGLLQLHKPAVKKEFDNIIYRTGGKPTAWYSIRRALNQVQAAVLWIHDTADDITPLEDARKVMEDEHPNIQFSITNGLGHHRIYKDISVQKTVSTFI